MVEDVALHAFGYDLNDPDFWSGCLTRCERRLEEFRALMDGGAAHRPGSGLARSA